MTLPKTQTNSMTSPKNQPTSRPLRNLRRSFYRTGTRARSKGEFGKSSGNDASSNGLIAQGVRFSCLTNKVADAAKFGGLSCLTSSGPTQLNRRIDPQPPVHLVSRILYRIQSLPRSIGDSGCREIAGSAHRLRKSYKSLPLRRITETIPAWHIAGLFLSQTFPDSCCPCLCKISIESPKAIIILTNLLPHAIMRQKCFWGGTKDAHHHESRSHCLHLPAL